MSGEDGYFHTGGVDQTRVVLKSSLPSNSPYQKIMRMNPHCVLDPTARTPSCTVCTRHANRQRGRPRASIDDVCKLTRPGRLHRTCGDREGHPPDEGWTPPDRTITVCRACAAMVRQEPSDRPFKVRPNPPHPKPRVRPSLFHPQLQHVTVGQETDSGRDAASGSETGKIARLVTSSCRAVNMRAR